MTKQTAFYVAIFSTAALAVGWYFRGWKEASGGMITALNRAKALGKARDLFAGLTVLVAVVFAVVLYVVATRHR